VTYAIYSPKAVKVLAKPSLVVEQRDHNLEDLILIRKSGHAIVQRPALDVLDGFPWLDPS
jgi:hypothetical protein